VAHPNYDDFWKQLAVQKLVLSAKVPHLNVGGWFDQEDFAGPWRIFAASETPDSRQYNYLVVGPWNHGGWFAGAGRTLKNIDFGSNTGDYFREHIQANLVCVLAERERQGAAAYAPHPAFRERLQPMEGIQ
jgi:hypothetical protein